MYHWLLLRNGTPQEKRVDLVALLLMDKTLGKLELMSKLIFLRPTWQSQPVCLMCLGIGGQFDNSSPYTSGYQIQPRYLQDIILISSVNDVEVANVQVFPNPNNGQFKINWLENTNGFHSYFV
jgi:hypothetical protein